MAIAYGYNNIKRSQPPTLTIGSEQPVNQLSDMLRAQIAMAGYTEVLTLSLCSKAENYELMGLEDDLLGGKRLDVKDDRDSSPCSRREAARNRGCAFRWRPAIGDDQC